VRATTPARTTHSTQTNQTHPTTHSTTQTAAAAPQFLCGKVKAQKPGKIYIYCINKIKRRANKS